MSTTCLPCKKKEKQWPSQPTLHKEPSSHILLYPPTHLENPKVSFSPLSLFMLLAMVSLPNMEENPPLTARISTVVPATPRSEESGEYRLNHIDLIMKLHYVRSVSFFGKEAAEGLTIYDVKKPMFPLLDQYSHLSGRIRRSESGRPFIKCNDAGVRIVESHCERTIEEWFQQKGCSFEDLVHDHVLGPDLEFSPLVFVKFTWFKCGGLCVGLSWSHVLGDAFSALNFIINWSHTLAGHVPPKPFHNPNPMESESNLHHNSIDSKNNNNPISFVIKNAKTVGEHWLATTNTNVVTHTFFVTPKILNHLITTNETPTNQVITKSSYFEILSALVWKYIAQIRREYSESESKGNNVITICTHGSNDHRENEYPTNNGLILSIVEGDNDISIGNSSISQMVKLIGEKKKKVENHMMEKLVEENDGKEDFIVYGTNLTFVDLEECNFYRVKVNGKRPILANCAFHGVGYQGVVLVIPAPQDKDENGGDGRMVTVSLPEKEIEKLKEKMEGNWGIGSYPF